MARLEKNETRNRTTRRLARRPVGRGSIKSDTGFLAGQPRLAGPAPIADPARQALRRPSGRDITLGRSIGR